MSTNRPHARLRSLEFSATLGSSIYACMDEIKIFLARNACDENVIAKFEFNKVIVSMDVNSCVDNLYSKYLAALESSYKEIGP